MVWKLATAALCLAIGIGAAARAGERGTPDEAKAMATKAAEYLKANGPDRAFAEFTSATSSFRDRDLYVFVLDESGKMLANGGNPSLVGRVTIDMKDVEGKAFGREMVTIKDAGWVDYKWPNPQTKAVEPKTTYIVRIGTYALGVGAYKN